MSRQSLIIAPLTKEQAATLQHLIERGWSFHNETRDGRQRVVAVRPDGRKRPNNDRRNSA